MASVIDVDWPIAEHFTRYPGPSFEICIDHEGWQMVLQKIRVPKILTELQVSYSVIFLSNSVHLRVFTFQQTSLWVSNLLFCEAVLSLDF